MKVKLNDRVAEFPPALHRVPPALSTAATRSTRVALGAWATSAACLPPQLSLVVWAVVYCRAARNWATLVFTNKKKNTRQCIQVLGGATVCLGQGNVKLLLLTYEHTLMYVVSRFLYGVSWRGIKKGLDKIPACTCYM